MSTPTKLTLIGLGSMGAAIAQRLLEEGFALTIDNRTQSKAAPFVAMGAQLAADIETAVTDAEVIISSLFDDEALESVCADLLPSAKKGAIHISASTILPKTAAKLAQQHQQHDVIYLAAPILGIPDALRAQTATVFCAGSEAAFTAVKPILAAYSQKADYVGDDVITANVVKISMNYVISNALELIAELFAFAEKSGMSTDYIHQALHQVYGHPAIKLYIDKIHARDFTNVNFTLQGGNKDITLFQQAFADVGVIPDIANMLKDKFTQALVNGFANQDWSAVSEVVRARSGLN